MYGLTVMQTISNSTLMSLINKIRNTGESGEYREAKKVRYFLSFSVYRCASCDSFIGLCSSECCDSEGCIDCADHVCRTCCGYV